MKLEGRIWQDKKTCLIEIEDLHIVTEGRSRVNALRMIEDAVESLVFVNGFKAIATADSHGIVSLKSNDTNQLTALLLRRQRESRGMSLATVAKRLGQSSPNAYGRYEQGTSTPSIKKLDELLHALSDDNDFTLRMTPRH